MYVPWVPVRKKGASSGIHTDIKERADVIIRERACRVSRVEKQFKGDAV